ncbi:MAG: hypothetical protein CMP76_14560 [Flavobacterium sp.]|nr:hypothetical protein [Flavobacterium sp.]|tara:strand:- start:162 stop:410 length:249 start_codon:yes stop_codon:yes gene_type:complete
MIFNGTANILTYYKMKVKITTFFLTLLMCLFSFVGFAQLDPPADDDPPAAPINSKLIWLAITGIVFAVIYFKNNIQKTKIIK